MKIKTFNRGEAQKAMDDWIADYPSLPIIDDELVCLRNDIQELNRQVREAATELDGAKRNDYYIDTRLGVKLYEYLQNQPWFTLRAAANDGFWRYLSINVAPDVVAQRWGKDNADHYYRKPTRIWFRSIWWYVHLAWQGDVESTEAVLFSKHFTTDTILNFEERTGKKGTDVNTYRKIIYYYSRIPEQTLRNFSKGAGNNEDDLFRVVMKLNTAKMMVMEPALCLGGEDGYARGLFSDAGVNIDVT